MRITILGNSSGGPFHGRHFTAQFVQVERYCFLVDCGEGTQMQLFDYQIKVERCNQIFISHLHGDHVFGLIGLITNWSMKRRTEPMQIFSPPGLRELIETSIRICGVRLSYPIEFKEVDDSVSALVFENKMVEVWSIPLQHRAPASGWLFKEKPKPRKINPEILEQYNIDRDYPRIKAIKSGADLEMPDGRIVPNAALTFDPLPSCSYAFCSDTMPSDSVAAIVRGVDLLYHEATFTDENIAEAEMSCHSTARQAAGIALKAGVKKLIIGHFSGRYANAEQHLLEARQVFEKTELAAEGSCFDIQNDTISMKRHKNIPPGPIHYNLQGHSQFETLKPAQSLNVRTSKFLSQILRHRPEKIGLHLDENGWADVAELLEKSAAKGVNFSRETLQVVVDTNDKKRFALSDDGLRIRASQGHSIEIDLDLKPQTPPEVLYHGTADKSIQNIQRQGLLPMRRQHVHLSKDLETAQKVGGRHGKAVVLTIRTGDMAREGYKFYLSENGVWLTREVPVGFIGLQT